MFGAHCIKTVANGKGAIMFWKDALVFKLPHDEQAATLKKKGIKIFEPAVGRPMNGWILVPPAHGDLWLHLAKVSIDFVGSLPATEKATPKTTAKKATGNRKDSGNSTPSEK